MKIKIFFLTLFFLSVSALNLSALELKGPFATKSRVILNTGDLQSPSSFYVEHGSATVMEVGTLSAGTLTLEDLNVNGDTVLGDGDSADTFSVKYSTWLFNALWGVNIGTTTDGSGTSLLFLDTVNRRIGMGTTTPGGSLSIQNDGGQSIVTVYSANTSLTNDSVIVLSHSSGTADSPVANPSGMQLGSLEFSGYGNAIIAGSEIRAFATELWDATSAGTRLEFLTTDNTTTTNDVRLVIDQNGNVGIGTDTTPDGQLEILSASDPTSFILGISSQNDTTGNILSVLGNGNIGIGNVSPTYTLDVAGDIRATQEIYGSSINANNANGLSFLDDDNNTRLFIDDNGYVGIDTVSPGNTLQVGDDTSVFSIIECAAAADEINGFLVTAAGSTRGLYYNPANSNDMRFRDADNTDIVTFEYSGDVGIGDISPDALLEILSDESPSGYILAVSSQNDVTGNILSILGNGNIGISSTTPAEKLSVVGNAIVTGQIKTSTMIAVNSNGLYLLEDGGKGIYLADGGATYFQGAGQTYFSGTVNLSATSKLRWTAGAANYGGIEAVGDDGLHIDGGVSAYGNRNIIITDYANRATDHDHELLSAHPMLFIHSVTDPDTVNTEWGSLSYVGDGTGDGYFEINTATGDIVLSPDLGNVGISSTSPTEMLSVEGNGIFTGFVQGSTFNAVGSAYQFNGVTFYDATGLYASKLTGTIPAEVLQTEWDNAYSHISNNGTDHSYIDQSLTIVSTPTVGGLEISSGTLDVRGATLALDDNELSGDKISGGTIDTFASTGIDDNATSTQFTVNDSSGDFPGNLIIDGNVGIGITNPSESLYVVGNGTFTGIVTASTFNAIGSAYQMNGVSIINSDGSISAYTNNASALTIGNGNPATNYQIKFDGSTSDGTIVWDEDKTKFVLNCGLDIDCIDILDHLHSDTIYEYTVSSGVTADGVLLKDGAIEAVTLNTGQGAYELYAMNQDALTTSTMSLQAVTIGGETIKQFAGDNLSVTDGVLSAGGGWAGTATSDLDMSSHDIFGVNEVRGSSVTLTGNTKTGVFGIFEVRISTSLDDTEEYEITEMNGKNGWGIIKAGGDSSSGIFSFTSDGVVTLGLNIKLGDSDDGDNLINIFDSGTTITIENQLGARHFLHIVIYFTD